MFAATDRSTYKTTDIGTYELCLPKAATLITMWWRVNTPGLPSGPFAAMHDISYGNRSNVLLKFSLGPTTGTLTIRALVDGVNYDVSCQVAN